MPTNSDLKRWYKVFNVKEHDFVRYDDMFRILCNDAVSDDEAVNLGQMKEYVAQHSGGGGLSSLKAVNLTAENTTVEYSDGINIASTAKFTDDEGEHNANMTMSLPIVSGDDKVIIKKTTEGEKIAVSLPENSILAYLVNDGIKLGVQKTSSSFSTSKTVIIGINSQASTYGTAIGYSADAKDYGVAIGEIAVCGGSNSIAIGYRAHAAYTSTVVGFFSSAGERSIVIGDNNVSAFASVIIGSQSRANEYGVAIGCKAYGASGIAIGPNALCQDNNRFVLSDGSYTAEHRYFYIEVNSSDYIAKIRKGDNFKALLTEDDLTAVEVTGNSISADDYATLASSDNAQISYNGLLYRKIRTATDFDELQFECIDHVLQFAYIFPTNAVVTSADEAAGQISVTDVSMLKVGMTISFSTPNGTILTGISNRKIVSIDTTNKKIKVDGVLIDSDTLTEGNWIAIKITSTTQVLTTATSIDASTKQISVADTKSLKVGTFIDFRTSAGSRIAAISGRKILSVDTANNKITVSGDAIDPILGSNTQITLASQVDLNKQYSRILRVYKNAASSTTYTVAQTNLQLGGEFITPSTATNDATSGTFTADEWSKLQANMNNKILFNNEIYRLNDPGHTPGIWSYVHTGWDGTDVMDKSINVTTNTGAWTLVMGQGGGVPTIKAGTGEFSEIFNYDASNPNTANGIHSHAEGTKTQANGNHSHAEGHSSHANGDYSHAEGTNTTAAKVHCHSEGYYTTADGQSSHAEGFRTSTSGLASHAEGYYTVSNNVGSHAEGKYNISPMPENLIHATGIGDYDAKRDGFEVYTTGEAWFKGPIYVGGVDDTGADIYQLDRTKAKKVATEEYVDSKVSGGGSSFNVQTFTINAADITATESGGSTEYALTASSLAPLKEMCLNAGKNGYLFATAEYSIAAEESTIFGKMYALIGGYYTGDTPSLLTLQMVDAGVAGKELNLISGVFSAEFKDNIETIKNSGGSIVIKIVSV